MSFAVTAEHEQLRDLLRTFLAKSSAPADVRRLMESPEGADQVVWERLAKDLGVLGLGIPEEYGGAGFGGLELAVVFEEMGRALLVSPYLSAVALAAPLLLGLGDADACDRWLPRIADGSLVPAVVGAQAGRGWEPAELAITATPTASGHHVLDGVESPVLDGHLAGLLLVIAQVGNEIGVFAVEGDAAGLTRTPLEVLDPTRKLATVALAATPAVRIGTGDASGAVARMLDVAVTALAAEQVGGAERCLEAAVDYARIRTQFGRPIGSFQAIKHKCADMLMAVESARSAAYYAAWASTESPDELARAAAVAKAYCSDAYLHVASENIQIHGGIGFTWEHDAHLYFRRAKASQLLFGDPDGHRTRLAGMAGF